MDKLRTLIIDDEAPARATLEILLSPYPFIDLIGTCADGKTAIQAIRKEHPDLIFLDIQMPEVSGFEVLRNIPEEIFPQVIFTTAYDQYAIEAFEINALDYLLKPFSDDRFATALQRARAAVENQTARQWREQFRQLLSDIPNGSPSRHLKKLSVKTGNRIEFVPVEQINWIAAENQYVRIHTSEGNYLMRESLQKLDDLLPPDKFYRTHRSYLVRLAAIQQVEPYFKGDYYLYLTDGAKIKLSRNRVEGLRKHLPW